MVSCDSPGQRSPGITSADTCFKLLLGRSVFPFPGACLAQADTQGWVRLKNEIKTAPACNLPVSASPPGVTAPLEPPAPPHGLSLPASALSK